MIQGIRSVAVVIFAFFFTVAGAQTGPERHHRVLACGFGGHSGPPLVHPARVLSRGRLGRERGLMSPEALVDGPDLSRRCVARARAQVRAEPSPRSEPECWLSRWPSSSATSWPVPILLARALSAEESAGERRAGGGDRLVSQQPPPRRSRAFPPRARAARGGTSPGSAARLGARHYRRLHGCGGRRRDSCRTRWRCWPMRVTCSPMWLLWRCRSSRCGSPRARRRRSAHVRIGATRDPGRAPERSRPPRDLWLHLHRVVRAAQGASRDRRDHHAFGRRARPRA